MLKKLKSLFSPPTPTGPAERLRAFSPADRTVAQDCVRPDGDGFRIDTTSAQKVRLFDFPLADVEQCLLTYRAEIKCERLAGRAYLEMWCRLPGSGEFFSKGFNQPVSGTCDWASYEIPFFLRKGQRPDLLRLNLAVEGAGTLWIRGIEVLRTPLSS